MGFCLILAAAPASTLEGFARGKTSRFDVSSNIPPLDTVKQGDSRKLSGLIQKEMPRLTLASSNTRKVIKEGENVSTDYTLPQRISLGNTTHPNDDT